MRDLILISSSSLGIITSRVLASRDISYNLISKVEKPIIKNLNNTGFEMVLTSYSQENDKISFPNFRKEKLKYNNRYSFNRGKFKKRKF